MQRPCHLLPEKMRAEQLGRGHFLSVFVPVDVKSRWARPRRPSSFFCLFCTRQRNGSSGVSGGGDGSGGGGGDVFMDILRLSPFGPENSDTFHGYIHQWVDGSKDRSMDEIGRMDEMVRMDEMDRMDRLTGGMDNRSIDEWDGSRAVVPSWAPVTTTILPGVDSVTWPTLP